MAILVDRNTNVITRGFTGSQGISRASGTLGKGGMMPAQGAASFVRAMRN